MVTPKLPAKSKANCRLGSYLLFSIALIVCLLTLHSSASLPCEMFPFSRNSFIRFFTELFTFHLQVGVKNLLHPNYRARQRDMSNMFYTPSRHRSFSDRYPLLCPNTEHNMIHYGTISILIYSRKRCHFELFHVGTRLAFREDCKEICDK